MALNRFALPVQKLEDVLITEALLDREQLHLTCLFRPADGSYLLYPMTGQLLPCAVKPRLDRFLANPEDAGRLNLAEPF